MVEANISIFEKYIFCSVNTFFWPQNLYQQENISKVYIKNYLLESINFVASLLLIEKMDIQGFSNRNNRKRDLSSGSKDDDDPKRQSEESPDVSSLDSPTSPGNAFTKSLKLNECVEILMNCLKNLEKEVKELKDSASSNNANQIKDDRLLLDLKDAVDLSPISLMTLNVTGWKRKKL